MFAELPSTAARENALTACKREGDIAQRIEACTELLGKTRDPQLLVRAHNTRGLALCDLNRCAEAVADFDEVVRLNPKIAGYFDNRARALRSAGRLSEAITDSERAIRLAPDYPWTYIGKADALEMEGRFGQALDTLVQATAVDPRNSGIWEFRGKLLGELGRYSEAYGAYRQSLSLQPDRSSVFKTRADTERQEGRLDEALADLQRYPSAAQDSRQVAASIEDLKQAIAQKREAVRDFDTHGSLASPSREPETLSNRKQQPTVAGHRLALVIGIDSYPNLGPDAQLRRAVSDAETVGDTLETIGFSVTRITNATSLGVILTGFDTFVSTISPGDVVVMFYAGHGIALDDGTYLVPSDVPALGPNDRLLAKRAAIPEKDLTQQIRAAGARVTLVIVDACRDNPFPRRGTRSIGAERGLARLTATDGTFTLYSAREGQTALDRLSEEDADKNSVFTRIFVKNLRKQGMSLNELGESVRDEVAALALTAHHDQVPAIYNDMLGSRLIFLAGP